MLERHRTIASRNFADKRIVVRDFVRDFRRPVVASINELKSLSIWSGACRSETKSNAFTLLMTLCEYSATLSTLDIAVLKAKLISFGENPPEEYSLAAREGVNNKKERGLRAKHLRLVLDGVVGS